MARKNSAQQAAQKKAKKQKKLLVVLGLGLVVALVFAATTLMHLGSKPVSATPPAATAPDGSTPAPNDIAVVIPGIAAAPAGPLHAFTAFGRKDPFNDGGPSALSTPTDSSKSPSGKGDGSGSTPKPPLTGAVISINGNKLALSLHAEFGHAPALSGVWLFRLVKVTQRTALIAVVGTHQQFTLHRRTPLTLQQNGGWRYTLILEPVGFGVPMTVQP